MEFLEGGQVNDLNYIRAHKIDPCEVSDKLGKLYSRMIFIHGFVHSDPHPGNILVKENDKHCDIILLDHGLYAVSYSFLTFFWHTFFLHLILVLTMEAYTRSQNFTSIKYKFSKKCYHANDTLHFFKVLCFLSISRKIWIILE